MLYIKPCPIGSRLFSIHGWVKGRFVDDTMFQRYTHALQCFHIHTRIKIYTALRHRNIQSDCKSKCMGRYHVPLLLHARHLCWAKQVLYLSVCVLVWLSQYCIYKEIIKDYRNIRQAIFYHKKYLKCLGLIHVFAAVWCLGKYLSQNWKCVLTPSLDDSMLDVKWYKTRVYSLGEDRPPPRLFRMTFEI